jgi:ACS family sodium-dependent inorganic phosphate cotransporter-like MFS transporter 5
VMASAASLLMDDEKPSSAPASAPASASAASPLLCSTRLTTALLLHVGLQLVYALRVLFSVAIIPISKQYGYGAVEQGYANAGFFAGYFLLQVPGGLAATRLGGHRVMFLGVLVPSLVTIVTPFACSTLGGLIVCRIFTGLLEGVTYPATHALLARWTPLHEKSQIVGLVWAGAYLGTALTLPLAGALVDDGSATGGAPSWPLCFFVIGGLGVAWAAAWLAFGASSPEELPRVSAEERAYIAAHRGAETPAGAALALPALLRAVARSPPAIVTCVAHFTHNWLFYMLLTEMPTYLTTIVGFNLQKSGSIALLPYLACFGGSVVFGGIADSLVKKRGWRIKSARIAVAVVAEVVPALCIAAAGFFSSVPVIIALLTASVGFSGASSASYASSYMDLAPADAGTLLAVGNTLATFAGIIAPIAVGDIVAAPNDDAQHWQTVFLVAAAIAGVGFLQYAVFVDDKPMACFADSAAAAGADGEAADAEAEDAGLVVQSTR